MEQLSKLLSIRVKVRQHVICLWKEHQSLRKWLINSTYADSLKLQEKSNVIEATGKAISKIWLRRFWEAEKKENKLKLFFDDLKITLHRSWRQFEKFFDCSHKPT